jgi:hypothetical protein
MSRRAESAVLVAALFALLTLACASETKYGAPKFTIEVTSEPVGAVLYVVEERDFDRFEGALDTLDLDDHRVGRSTAGAPLTTTVRAYAQVLVGDWDGSRATLRFTPSANGARFTVHAP